LIDTSTRGELSITVAEWRFIGEIQLLQMQLYAMTGTGEYDLDALIEADRLRLTSDGLYGLSDHAWIMDRHHRHHPDARHWHAADVLSFGFTSHYDHMWKMFRRTPVGIAGENIIVDTPDMLTIDDIADGMRIETDHGTLEFNSPEIAEPCVEFTRFLTDRRDADASDLKPWREMLRNGVRGYVVGIEGDAPFEVATGDRVSVRAGGS
jgi:hypothetical protein